jgi:two-component system response regulator FixJ
MVFGRLNKADRFRSGIAIRTVEAHRASVMGKLGARSLSDVLRITFAAGFGETVEPA